MLRFCFKVPSWEVSVAGQALQRTGMQVGLTAGPGAGGAEQQQQETELAA